MWFRLNLIIFFVVLLIQINAKPFLKNPLQTLSSSISSASSSPISAGNIADLRKRRLDKIRQLSPEQSDEDEDLLLEDNDDEAHEMDDQEKNEVLPNLLQKKVAKIMRKLQFLAQLINRFTPTDAEDKGGDDKDFDVDFDSDEIDEEANSTVASVAVGQKRDETFDLTNDNNANKEEFIEDLTPMKKGEAARNKSSGLGVHFLEVLGSLFGIIYGAAIQLTNGGNSKPSL